MPVLGVFFLVIVVFVSILHAEVSVTIILLASGSMLDAKLSIVIVLVWNDTHGVY